MTGGFVTLLDFIGTFVFAISGAVVAVRHRLDLFGVDVDMDVDDEHGGLRC